MDARRWIAAGWEHGVLDCSRRFDDETLAQLAPTIFGASDPQAVRSWRARLLRFEPWRFDAALHALATAGEMRRLDEIGLPTESLLRVTEPERWHAIEDAVERLCRLGLATTHEDLDDVYRGAVAEGTGR